MTPHELRVLYLLRKEGGRAKLSVLTAAMHRVKAKDRERAMKSCEQLDLISSALVAAPKTRKPGPGHGGPGHMVLWLKDAGQVFVQDLIDRNLMPDPDKENRAGPKKVAT